MINENSKSGKFSEAIKRFNEEERAKVIAELEEKKKEAVAQAEQSAKYEADKYVHKLISAKKSEITGKYAVKNLEAQGELFKARDKMVKEIFSRCEKELTDYSETPEYKEKLIGYAREIASAFEGKSCTLYVKNDDLKFENDIKSVFEGEVKVEGDISIRIGGIRGFCDELKLVADNTLDSKLDSKKSWFVENADLKIS